MTVPIEIDPAAKYQIPNQFLSPNTCVGCNITCSDQKNFAVDLKKFIKFYGQIYLCRNCIEQLAGIFGLITPEKYEGISDRLASKELELVHLEKENYNLKQVIDGYRNLGSLASGNFSESFSNPVLEVTSGSDDVEQPSEETEVVKVGETETEEGTDGDNLLSESDSELDGPERKTDESSISEGPTDVRSNSSDNSEYRDDLFG